MWRGERSVAPSALFALTALPAIQPATPSWWWAGSAAERPMGYLSNSERDGSPGLLLPCHVTAAWWPAAGECEAPSSAAICNVSGSGLTRSRRRPAAEYPAVEELVLEPDRGETGGRFLRRPPSPALRGVSSTPAPIASPSSSSNTVISFQPTSLSTAFVCA